jgi:hypothetical protein
LIKVNGYRIGGRCKVYLEGFRLVLEVIGQYDRLRAILGGVEVLESKKANIKSVSLRSID